MKFLDNQAPTAQIVSDASLLLSTGALQWSS